jgi:hypothetical protein
MNRTTPPLSAKLSRSSAQTTDPIADELRRYDDPLRDIRGLAAGTRRHEPEGKLRRDRAPDSLIGFLRTL